MALAIAVPAQAQLSLSATADAGVTYGFGQGGRYGQRELTGVRLAGGIRLMTPRSGVFIEASNQSLVNFFNRGDRCVIDGTGGCPPDFPEVQGPSLVGGIVVRPTDWFEVRAGGGAARYRTNEPSVANVRATVGLADIAFFPLSQFGAALVVQHVALSRYHDDHLTIIPRTLALRVR